jgi:hypothetical protein
MTEKDKDSLHEGAVFQGFLLGAIVGGLMWLWRLPQSGDALRARLFGAGRDLRERLTPGDPVADSLAEGKAIARQRQASTTPEKPR